jgi:hypothetical protein
MMTSLIYLRIQILAVCIALSLSSDEHNTFPPDGCSYFNQQELELRCRNLNLSRAPAFQDARLLKKLDLSSNTITSLEINFFDGYDNLDILIMRNCKIQKMDPGAFNPLKKLKTVDLSRNSFTSVPPELFTENPKLQNLTLSNNPLTMQPLDLPILISSSLQYLNLKECKLSDLSTTSLSQVPNLRFLDLSGNRFTVLSVDTLIPLSHLVYIDIRGNEWDCCADFYLLVCLAYDKSNSQPFNISCSVTKHKKNIYPLQTLYDFCKRLFNISTKLRSIISAPTAPIGGVTDTKITPPVPVFPNTAPQSGISSNINSEQHENMHESTKGLEEDVTVNVTKKPLGTNNSEDSHESREEAATSIPVYVYIIALLVIKLFVVLFRWRDEIINGLRQYVRILNR